ncbi:MAG: hypothetical protein ACLFM7_07350 [Bacteroidales bacterium]
MKMNKSNFQKLPEGEKASLVMDKGKQISRRKVSNYFVSLYSLEEFMVEVWYHSRTNKIENVEIVEDHTIIDKYIDEEVNRKKG